MDTTYVWLAYNWSLSSLGDDRRKYPTFHYISTHSFYFIAKLNRMIIKGLFTAYFHLLGILLIALNGLNTLIVLIAVKFRLSTCRQYSIAPDKTIKKSKRFHESAKYVPLPNAPMAIILTVISNEKNAKMMSSNICERDNIAENHYICFSPCGLTIQAIDQHVHAHCRHFLW